jgi:hypothetical protein
LFATAFAASVAFALGVTFAAFLIAFAALASVVAFALGLPVAIGVVLVVVIATLAVGWRPVVSAGAMPWLPSVALYALLRALPSARRLRMRGWSSHSHRRLWLWSYSLLLSSRRGRSFRTMSSTRRVPLAAIPLILSFRISAVQFFAPDLVLFVDRGEAWHELFVNRPREIAIMCSMKSVGAISYWSNVHWCATKSNVSIAKLTAFIFCFTTLQCCRGSRAASPNTSEYLNEEVLKERHLY